jgi:hypothetical protein
MKRWAEDDPSWRTKARQVTWEGDDDPERRDNPEPSPRVLDRSVFRCVACGAPGDCGCVVTWFWSNEARDFIDHPPRPAPRRLLPILDGWLSVKKPAALEGCPPATAYDPVWEAARFGEEPRAIRARQEPTGRPGKRGKLDVRVSWQKCRIQTGAEHDRDADYAHEQWWLPEHERRSPSSRSSARWSFSDEPWVLDVPEVRSLDTRLLLTAEELLGLPDHVLSVIEGLPIAPDNHANPERRENIHIDPDAVHDHRRPTPSLRRATPAARRTHRLRVPHPDGDAPTA